MKIPQNILKYGFGLLVVIGLRLLPHPPNVEPIMATIMPFSKKWGALSGMIFALVAILSYDIITGTIGVWTIFTASTYALIGISAGFYFKNKENKIKHYVGFAIIATIIFDAVTGIGLGVLFFDMPFMVTLLGQIEFTLYHLAGNIVLASVLSPSLYKWVITNPKFETNYVFGKLSFGFK